MYRIFIALAVCVVIFPHPLPAAETLSQDDFLEEWASKLAEIASLKQTHLFKIAFEMQGIKQHTEMSVAIAFCRPDRLVLETQFITTVCDGSNVYIRIPRTGTYMVSEQKDQPLDKVIEEHQFLSAQLLPDIQALLSSNPHAKLKELLRNVALEILADEKIGDREYRVIRFVDAELAMLPNVNKGFKFWIDKEFGLIYRAQSFSTETPDKAMDEDKSRLAEMMQNMEITVEVTQQMVNASLPDSAFVFTPNPRDKKVETTFGLWGSRSGAEKGFSRFALSGKPAPDFTMTLLDGSEFRLSDHTGSVVLLDFWATWCGPCIRALPEMRKLHEIYGTSGVVVVGISRDKEEHRDKVRATLEKHGIVYSVGIDSSGSIASSYRVEGIPCLVLINREGIVQGRKVGFAGPGLEALRKDIDDVLAGKEIGGAKPLTEAELKELEEEKIRQKQWAARSVDLDTNLFRCIWRSSSSPRPKYITVSSVVAIPPAYVVVRQDTQLTALSVASGHSNAVFKIPEKDAPIAPSLNGPLYYFLRGSTSSVLAAVETRYTTSDEHADRYTFAGLELYGISHEGSVIWTKSLDRSWHSVSAAVLPLDGNTDALLLAGYGKLMIVSAQGENLLTQRTDYNDRFVFFVDPQGRTMVLAERSDHVGLYELVVPLE